MTRHLRDRLVDIQAAATDILGFVHGLDEAAFVALPLSDRRTYRAIKNALAEIGEAIKALPSAIPAEHRDIDWRGFAGLPDIVAHHYFGLELPRLWPTIADELPALVAAVEAEIARLPDDENHR